MWTKRSLVGLLLWSAVVWSNNSASNVMADEDVLAEVLEEEVVQAAVEEENQGQSPPVAETTDEASPKVKEEVKAEIPFNVRDHTDWGSYYDPQNIFCGKFDCYKILGFDYESFGSNRPNTKVITKRYRNLSREWHPDKSKHKDAKNRFVVGR
jgi:hypothetical protein